MFHYKIQLEFFEEPFLFNFENNIPHKTIQFVINLYDKYLNDCNIILNI